MLMGTCRKLNTEKRLMIMNVDSEPKPNVDKTETWRTSAHQLRLIASDFLPVWTGFLHDRILSAPNHVKASGRITSLTVVQKPLFIPYHTCTLVTFPSVL